MAVTGTPPSSYPLFAELYPTLALLIWLVVIIGGILLGLKLYKMLRKLDRNVSALMTHLQLPEEE
ncbi:hypothetical protein ACR6HW_08530 [Fusibacter sp. JL298sf-3]